MNTNQPTLKTAWEYYQRASEHFCEEEFDKAEEDCTESILRDETFRQAWFLRGDIYSETGKHGPAIENFMQTLRLLSTERFFPGDRQCCESVILCRIANVNLAQGNLEEAIRNGGVSAELMENHTFIKDFCEPWYIQGAAWSKKGDIENALRCFGKAMEKDVYDFYHLGSLLGRARILRKLWRVDEALDDCNTVLQHDSCHAEAFVERACCRCAAAFEWSNEDLEDLRTAVKLSPKHPEARAMLADCLFGTGRLEEAGEAAAKALALNSGNEKRAVRLGNIMAASQ